MEQAISINSMDEYIGELTARFAFTVTEHKNELTLSVPEKMGAGSIRMHRVSGDISIGVIDMCLNFPLVSYFDSYDNTCEINYCLSGHVAYSETGVPKASLGKNEVGVSAIPRSRGMMLIPSGERVLVAAVCASRDFYGKLPYSEECDAFADPSVQEALCHMAKPVTIGAKLHNYFDRILENEMRGELQNIYLDSLG